MTDRQNLSGSGPGVITPDGCAVDFYARIAARDEPEIVHDAIPAGASILDGDRIWTHNFTARRLDGAAMAEALEGSGLRLDRYLTEDRSWLRAVPA